MAVILEREKMERKIINITGKRQITIPINFYEKIGFEKEIECYSDGNVMILKPLKTGTDDFSVEILKDLVAQGYEGDELIAKFEEESEPASETDPVTPDKSDTLDKPNTSDVTVDNGSDAQDGGIPTFVIILIPAIALVLGLVITLVITKKKK